MPQHVVLFAAVFWAILADSSLAEALNSPYIVPVAGTVMILGIVVAGIWSGVRTREMRSQERLAAIARGIPLESEWDRSSPREAIAMTSTTRLAKRYDSGGRNDGANSRRAGLILCGVGLGLCAFFAVLAAVLQVRAVLCGGAAGLIPLAIGIAFLIDGRLRRVEFNREMEDTADRLGRLPASDA